MTKHVAGYNVLPGNGEQAGQRKIGVSCGVIVHAISKGLHIVSRGLGQIALILCRNGRPDVQPAHQKIGNRCVGAFVPGSYAAIGGESFLHGAPVIFGLGVRKTESRIDVSLPLDMRYTAVVAFDDDVILLIELQILRGLKRRL